MRINIGYFTSTGNTLWLCLKGKELMEQQGHTVKLYEIIKDKVAFAQDECDLTGFFYPVWGSNQPDPMVEYRNNMPQGNGQKIFFVGNCCALNGDTGFYFKQILDKKGYDVFFTDHLYMPTNFNLPYEPGNYWKRVPLAAERDRLLATAEAKLQQICDSILNGERKVDGKGVISRLAGALQRKSYWIVNGYKSHFSVAKEKCINCGLCIRMCPSENITENAAGEKVFGNKCILCVKCYNLCPVNAVLICKKSINDKKYRRYKGPCQTIKPTEYRA
ncbi:MAG: EFR1 family ferrodoxin [Victivallaceae bacterium]|nr:EFR1 family ferrodoxin [Victivallaceae bacterium]